MGTFPLRHTWFFLEDFTVIKMTTQSREAKTNPAASAVRRKQLGEEVGRISIKADDSWKCSGSRVSLGLPGSFF